MKLIIPGEPVPKLRARTVSTSHGVRTYTPSKTADAEDRIRLAWIQAGRPQFSPGTALRVVMRVYMSKPPSAPKKRRFPITRPDLDNCFKIIDSLNGLAFDDDARIVVAHMEKRYVEYPDTPRTEIEIEEEL